MDRKICLDSDIIIEILKDNKEVIGRILSLEVTFKKKENQICIENKLELLTNNKKHFEKLKQFGLKII